MNYQDNPESKLPVELKVRLSNRINKYINNYGDTAKVADVIKIDAPYVDLIVSGDWRELADTQWQAVAELPDLYGNVTLEQIEAWKAEHGKYVFNAYAVMDDGEVLGCYFKLPPRGVLSNAFAFAARQDYISAGQTILNSIAYLGGDDFVKKDELQLSTKENMACVAIFTFAYTTLNDHLPQGGGSKN